VIFDRELLNARRPAERILFGSKRFRDERLFLALVAIREALRRSRKPYIAFSGGKDSVAVTALVHMIAPDVPLLWSDDELEYPELVSYMAAMRAVAGPQLTITLGWTRHAGWFDPWRDLPFWREPFERTVRVEMDVDEYQAVNGYDLTFLGLRMGENRRRRSWLSQVGAIYPSKTGTGRRCCPIWDWSADDVWALIAGWELPYCSAYDRYDAIHVPRHAQRIGPLPLARRAQLEEGWPELLAGLEARDGGHWLS